MNKEDSTVPEELRHTGELAKEIFLALQGSRRLKLEGLGVFERDKSGTIILRDANPTRIFIAYAKEDAPAALRLYQHLLKVGFAPWLDSRKLLPGQNWPRRIQDAIESSDFFIACFSTNSVTKRGGFQAELRYALECASRVPLDEVFLVPVRLDDCRVPERIQKETQYVDLFPDWLAGFESLLRIIDRKRLKYG